MGGGKERGERELHEETIQHGQELIMDCSRRGEGEGYIREQLGSVVSQMMGWG